MFLPLQTRQVHACNLEIDNVTGTHANTGPLPVNQRSAVCGVIVAVCRRCSPPAVFAEKDVGGLVIAVNHRRKRSGRPVVL